MKELAIHCTIYVQNPDGWNEDNLENDAETVLDSIATGSVLGGSWNFDFQVYDAKINEY